MPSGLKDSKPVLETTLDSALLALNGYSPKSPEYVKTMETIQTLHKMKQADKPARVSPDTAITVLANLLGIVMILKHERVDIITSKALSFIPKIR